MLAKVSFRIGPQKGTVLVKCSPGDENTVIEERAKLKLALTGGPFNASIAVFKVIKRF